MLSKSDPHHGFTLIELTIVMLVAALILGGMTLSLTTLREVSQRRDTERQLSEIRDALQGFVIINGRLPCPASARSYGMESFCNVDTEECNELFTGEPQTHGRCAHYFGGFLPGVALGLPGLSANGFLLDAWGTPSNQIRYAVANATIGSTNHAATTANGIRSATLSELAATSKKKLLAVCSSTIGINGVNCGSTNKLTDSALAVIFSLGRHSSTAGIGTDEAENLDGDALFISHPPSASESEGGEFDDIVTWISTNTLLNRMVSAGRLP